MSLSAIAAGGLVAVALATAAPAQKTAPATAPLLTLQNALAFASGEQPMVSAYTRDAQASEQAAVAAGSLPDPQLTVGVQDYPVTGSSAFSPNRNDFTMYMLGVMREQVRRSKRDASTAQLNAEAAVSREQATAEQLHIRRDVMVEWLNAVEASAKVKLLDRVIADLKTGQKVMESGVKTGSSSPALALEAQAEVALADVQLAEAKGDEAHARAELERWIGDSALRPLPDDVPNLALPPEMPHGQMLDHPHLRIALAQEKAAERQVDVARTDRRPDFTWSVNYGFRPSFGNLVTAQVSIPLQLNQKELQDRKIAEAQERVSAAALRAEDERRDLESQYRTALADYRAADAQLVSLRTGAIPSLEAAFKTAQARYAGGLGSLDLPLTIVRRYVETNISLVEQEGKRARAAAEIIYLSGEDAR